MRSRDLVSQRERRRLSSRIVARSTEVHGDVVTEPRLAALEVGPQDLRNVARSLRVVLAEDLDAKRLELRAVLRNTVELPESALVVAGHLGPDLQRDLGAVESRLGLVDSSAANGVAVVGALLVVSEVDGGHHGAVAPDVCLDQGVGKGVVAVLAALVDQALLAEDLRRGLLRGELAGGGQAVGVGASDLGDLGESSGVLLGGLVGPQLAHLLVVRFARSTVGLDGRSVAKALLPVGSPVGLDSRPGVEGRDGQTESRSVSERDLSQCVGSSIGRVGDASESGVRERDVCQWVGSSISWLSGTSERGGGSDGRLLGRDDARRHPFDPPDRVGDRAAVDHNTIDLDYIVGEGVGTVVVLVGTHGRDWLGVVGMCVGRVCELDE